MSIEQQAVRELADDDMEAGLGAENRQEASDKQDWAKPMWVE